MKKRVAALAVLGFASAANAAGLEEAARAGDVTTLRALLGKGGDVNTAGPDGSRAIHWIVRLDDLEAAKLLVSARADVSIATDYGVRPLHLAAANGSAGMIRLLLEAGADPNAADGAGETALMTAARSGNADAVKALLDRGATVDARDTEFQQTALMFAVRANDLAVVRLLIDRKADVNAQTRTGKPPAWRRPGAGGGSHGVGIVRGGWPARGMRDPAPGAMTPLLYAARDGRLEIAQALLAAGADVKASDANGITPLLMAITNAKTDVAKFLIEHGAPVNAVDWYGRTPLWAAVDVRNLEKRGPTRDNGVDRAAMLQLIRVLLEKGADVNARTKEVQPVRRFIMPLGSLAWVDVTGETPFFRAALSGDVTVMRELLRHGADSSIATFSGTTPLMAAAGVNWVFNQTYDEGPAALLEAVKLCHELGADVNAANSMGLRAIHGAANRGSDDIVRFLVGKGASLEAADAQGRTPLTWAQGVFLATNAPEPKPSTIALIRSLESKGGI
jgi:ankyrin repeat protein